MADDNILEIGALVNLTGFTPQFSTMVTTTEAGTRAMAANFQQLSTTTLSSTAQMTTAFASVAPAAQVIPPAIKKVEVQVKESTNSMWTSFKELALGIKEESLKIVESVSEVGAKVSETAERTRLGVGTMEAGFSGLAGILGAGIAVGFFADFLDETARVLIELGHLNESTQISVETLSGLRAVAQQNAIPFEQLQVALARVQRAQIQALEGSKMYVQAFKDLGISVDELRNMKPEDVFFALANGIATASAPQIAMNSGITLLGRGVYSLIPLLEKYGTNLKQVSDAAAKNSGVTEDAVKTAEQWHEQTAKLSQLFQAAMVPVLEAVVNILPKMITFFDTVGGIFLGLANITATLIVAFIRLFGIMKDILTLNFNHLKDSWENFKNVFTSGIDEVKSNWDAAWNHINDAFRKPPPSTWFDRANQMMKDLGLNSPKFDLSGIKSTAKTDIVQQFREQLDQMKDAEKGFHELSKNEEAAFWQSKLNIVRGNVAAYREVYHELVAAERAARHQSLAEEMSNLEQRLAAERAGSQQRIVILEEELNYFKRIGAEQTAEARRVENMLVTARRESAQQDERDFIKNAEQQISESKRSAQAKIDTLNQLLFFALNTYTVDSEAYRKLTELKVKAEKELQQEQQEIRKIDDDAEKAHQQHLLELQRSAIEQRFSLGLISNAQRIALEKQVTDQEYALAKAALEAKLALYKQEPVEYERVLKQLEALEDKHVKQMQQIDQQDTKNRMANWLKFENEVTNGFSAAVGKWVETGKGFGTAMAQMWNHMVVQFAEMLARMLAQFILHQLTKVVVAQTSEAAQTTAAAAGAQQRGGIGLIEDIKSIGRAAAVGAAHAFKWVMEEVPFPVNVALAPAIAAATFAGIIGFAALAGGGKAAKGGLLAENGPVFAHAGEMILPPKISEGMQKVISAGTFTPPTGATSALGVYGQGGNSTVHHHNVSVGAPRINVSVSGTEGGLRDLHNRVTETIRRAVRNGANFGFEGV